MASYLKSLSPERLRYYGGVMGMMGMTPDERAGMMIDHPGMPGMMGPGMMMH